MLSVDELSVTWMHLDRVMFLTVDDTTITLIPRFRVTREEVSTYRGTLQFSVPGHAAVQRVIRVRPVPPEFIDEESSPSHVAVQEGNDVRLVCRAKGVPKPSIHWTREDGKTFTTVRGSQVRKIESEELVLNGVTRKDMGAYLCIASNKVPPSISKRIVLEIHFQPLITVPNQLVGAPIDTTVTLECQVSAFPNAVHFWRFKSQLLINSTRQETQEIKNGYKTTMRLSLRNLRDTDFGTYVCAAKNSLGETESNVRLYEIVVPRGSDDREDETHDELVLPEHHNDVRPIEPWRRSGTDSDLDSDTSGYTLNENNYIRNRSPMTNGGAGGIRGSSTSGRAGMSSSTSGISSSTTTAYVPSLGVQGRTGGFAACTRPRCPRGNSLDKPRPRARIHGPHVTGVEEAMRGEDQPWELIKRVDNAPYHPFLNVPSLLLLFIPF
ncbi:lachesin-like [Penaeus monodon]|uniref:lachesin-like n=1 Tax=Penaeus monodon TaxID=6687 RepID=UPI0018A6E3B7|nr:lachesin-like [Penaeus monodon]